MADSNEIVIPKFWRELLSRLRDQPLLCIVGYGFHAGYGLPHFHDTIRGGWSRADARNNPFIHPEQTGIVLQWAEARRNVALQCAQFRAIPAYAYRKSIDRLAYLQQVLHFKIADQCPDGFLAANGLADVIELYGCVTRGRCILCGAGTEAWRCDDSGAAETTCVACGGAVFPGISMFGWNRRDESWRELGESIAEARSLLIFGVDWEILPFTRPELIAQEKQIIEFWPGNLLISGHENPVPMIELAKVLYKKDDVRLKEIAGSSGSFDETLSLFCEICSAWERAVIAE